MSQERKIQTVGIVGAGAMGGGIAQISAAVDHRTLVFDQRDGAARTAISAINARMEKRAAQGKATEADVRAIRDNLVVAEKLSDLAVCDLVVEAIVEDLDAKRSVFEQLTQIVDGRAILASNTSSLPIGAICRGLDGPERFAGLHFFNPVPVMKLVEVIAGPDTSSDTIDLLMGFGERTGREPIKVKDSPGFLVNFGGRAYGTEALAIVNECVATPAQIDAVMRECCGFRMGPFELMDLTGMDVNYPVTAFVHNRTFGDPRMRSVPLHRYMVDVGKLGRKTGEGFYSYGEDDQKPSADSLTDAPPPKTIVLPPDETALHHLFEVCAPDAQILTEDDGTSPLIAALIGEDCATYCARTGADHKRFVAIDLQIDTARRVTIMTAPGADMAVRDQVIAALASQRAVTAIADSPGFIGQRILAMIANLGCEMAQNGLASPQDINKALRLGLNYPMGPLEFADSLGVGVVHRIMTQLQLATGDDRYRASQWLRRRAQLGLDASSI